MSDVRAAVVGAGFIGPVHVEALLRIGVEVTGVLGVSDAESRATAERLGLSKAYRSFEEVLEDGAVKVVHIATPNRLHYPMAKAVLEAGKHVLCEKPLAMNSAESQELVELARTSGLAAAVNYNIRYYPLCLEAADIVRRGDLGDVYSVCGSYVQDWLLYPTDYNWRVLAEEGGELRAIADIGTHWLDLVHAITGLEVEAVCADLSTVHPVRQRPLGEVQTFKGKEKGGPAKTEPVDITTEDYGAVLMRFKEGARGCLEVSQVTAGRKNCLRYEIAGAQRALTWCSERPNELWAGHRNRPNETLIRDPALVSDRARHFINYPGGHNEGFPDTFKQCFRAFYEYIEAGDFAAPPTFPTLADGHREIVLCEAILRSHREQRWVELKGDRS
ncbi:Gfo/Idh/MocA family protein [Anaerobaca lacustris]|uniref:Gfo/Idh/MocA family oxidoreductase n=1 Tax=Anaerobaca lacustris TaxID=3044600 RepID=A0AAW6TSW3_9BACT|nr:Gfo/Idh/MocA family oxidoreductase [Sedimentisphaerales bacterium M17dextr]